MVVNRVKRTLVFVLAFVYCGCMATVDTSPPGTACVPVMDGVRRVHAVLDTVETSGL